MSAPEGRVALKALIGAADRAAARGAPGEALRLLLGASPVTMAPDHDHVCPECGEAWSHLDEPCDDVVAPMRCGWCENETRREADAVDIDPVG
jgi:hypothetical protein